MNKNNKIKIYLLLICFIFANFIHTSIVSGNFTSKSCLACKSEIEECGKVFYKVNLKKIKRERDINDFLKGYKPEYDAWKKYNAIEKEVAKKEKDLSDKKWRKAGFFNSLGRLFFKDRFEEELKGQINNLTMLL